MACALVMNLRVAGGWTLVAIGVVLASTIAADAADPTVGSSRAETLVLEALHGEIYGSATQRTELLDEASRLDPDFLPAKWHRGLVNYHDQWVSVDSVSQLVQQDPVMAEYQSRRARAGKTAADRLALATWCCNHGLKEQARAHLFQVIEESPQNVEARKRLGFRRVAGIWVHRSVLEEIEQQQESMRAAIDAWEPRLRHLTSQLNSKSEPRRQAALAKIRELSDPEAIPALEATVASHSQPAALAVLDAFATMPGVDPSLALMRQGMLSPWPDVRHEAARQLKQRPLGDFVPFLLDTMRSPVTTRSDIAVDPNGRLVHRVVLQQEARTSRELAVVDTDYVRSRRTADPFTLPEALRRMARFEVATVALTSRQNAGTIVWNQRAGTLLSAVSGQPPAADPGPWWQWWSQETERQMPPGQQKPEQVSYSRGFQFIPTRQPVLAQSGGGSLECLAKGTVVRALAGLVAIEQVEPGDVVLAQDPETGELAFKPVLRVTARPPEELVRLHAGTESWATTGGHLFWVAGEGWVKARRLRPGMQLHTTHGSVQVRMVEPAESAETYNLVVADFSTFFVGKQAVLSHDFTEPRPTSAVVPGLVGVVR